MRRMKRATKMEIKISDKKEMLFRWKGGERGKKEQTQQQPRPTGDQVERSLHQRNTKKAAQLFLCHVSASMAGHVFFFFYP